MVSGQNIRDLANVKFVPGKTYKIEVYVDRPPTRDQIAAIQADLKSRGVELRRPVMARSGNPPSIVIEVRAPSAEGYGWFVAVPFAGMIVLSIAAAGVVGIVGWRVGQLIELFAKNLIPIALVGVAGFVIYKALPQLVRR